MVLSGLMSSTTPLARRTSTSLFRLLGQQTLMPNFSLMITTLKGLVRLIHSSSCARTHRIAGAKSTAMINLVKQLQADGVPIDGIGIEGHLIVGEVPTTMVENFNAFTALGVEISINELDIRMTLPSTDALLEQQKQDYQTVVSACMQVEKCVGVTLWDYTDKVRPSE